MRGLLAAHRDRARVDGPELRVTWERTGELRALDRHDLADQRERDLGLAVRHLLRGIVAASGQHPLLDHPSTLPAHQRPNGAAEITMSSAAFAAAADSARTVASTEARARLMAFLPIRFCHDGAASPPSERALV